MKYPKYYVYEEIYKRYFNRGVTDLIELGNIKAHDKVLDICGGNGRLSKELIKYTDDVSYLDQEKDMIPDNLNDHGINVYNESIQDFLENSQGKYNKVFCQQAINYWLLNIDINKFSSIFEKNGLFIFNTFTNKPTESPMVKEYEIDGSHFLEISYLVQGKVYHIQIREGYEPHFTVFDWIDEKTYNELLSPYFEVESKTDGKTSLYKCRRK